MPYFIKHTYRKTATVYLIEAETKEEAEQADGEYLGVVDGDDTDSEVFAPHETALEAKMSLEAWVD